MLVLETIAKMRRLSLVQGKSIKEICRDLRISRKVVRKVLRSGSTEFRYERQRQPKPKIGPWQAQLDALLDGNGAKQKRERLTLIRIYEELRALGYEGSYDAIRRYAKSRDKARGVAMGEAYVPLLFAPGESVSLHCTLIDEHFRVEGRRTWFETIDEMQAGSTTSSSDTISAGPTKSET